MKTTALSVFLSVCLFVSHDNMRAEAGLVGSIKGMLTKSRRLFCCAKINCIKPSRFCVLLDDRGKAGCRCYKNNRDFPGNIMLN